MARLPLGAASAVASLVLAVAWAALWVRSYVRADILAHVDRPAPGHFRRVEVASIVGLFSCDLHVVELDMATLTEMPWELTGDGWRLESWTYGRGDVRRRLSPLRAFRLLDFAAEHQPRVSGLSDDGPAVRWERWSVTTPYWALVLGFATPFLWRTRRRRVAARAAAAAAVSGPAAQPGHADADRPV